MSSGKKVSEGVSACTCRHTTFTFSQEAEGHDVCWLSKGAIHKAGVCSKGKGLDGRKVNANAVQELLVQLCHGGTTNGYKVVTGHQRASSKAVVPHLTVVLVLVPHAHLLVQNGPQQRMDLVNGASRAAMADPSAINQVERCQLPQALNDLV